MVRELLLAMAPKMEQAGHREVWMPYLGRGSLAASVRATRLAVAEYQLQLGMLYRMVSEFEPAKAWLTASEVNFAKDAVAGLIKPVRSMNWPGWSICNTTMTKRRRICAAGILLPVDHPECGMSYRGSGMIAIGQRKWEEAELLHRKALSFFEQQSDQRRIAWGLQNLATALTGQRKFTATFGHYQKAAKILLELNDRYNWAIVQMNLGLAYLYAGQPELAVPCLFKAEDIAYQLKDTLQMARIDTNQGLVYLALQDYQKAENAFRAAARLYTKLMDDRWRLNAIDGLAMAYLAEGKWTDAAQVLEAALRDLPRIAGMPNHAYLLKSLNEHLQQARAGQGLSMNSP